MGAPRGVVGDVRIRTDKQGNLRAWVKVAEPNRWRPRAQVVWEKAHGPIPPGLVVHHRNRITTDDALNNLSLISVANHLAEHRSEFEQRRIAAVVGAKRSGARIGPIEPTESASIHGSAHGMAKLNENDVREIRRLYATGNHRQIDLARKFGVKQANVSQIVRRLNWQHI